MSISDQISDLFFNETDSESDSEDTIWDHIPDYIARLDESLENLDLLEKSLQGQREINTSSSSSTSYNSCNSRSSYYSASNQSTRSMAQANVVLPAANAARNCPLINQNVLEDAFAVKGPNQYKFALGMGLAGNILNHRKVYGASMGLAARYFPQRMIQMGRRIYIANAADYENNANTLPEAAARAAYREGLIAFMCEEIPNPILTKAPSNDNIFIGVIGAKDSWINANVAAKVAQAELTIELVEQLANDLLRESTDAMKNAIPSNLALAFIAMSKRGAITPQKLMRVIQDLNTTGLDINIPYDMVGVVFKDLEGVVNRDNARATFQAWANMCGHASLRLQIILQQSTGTGLTCISAIRNAYALFPNCPWEEVADLLPADFARAQEALQLINNNPYYAWGPMGQAAATRYRSLAWFAKELLNRHGGPDYASLGQSLSFTREPAKRQQLEMIIQNYQPQAPAGGNVNIAEFQQLVNANPLI